ncbi:hypothetical protein [Paenibacillus silvae]|uniref:hypothetical protein n=1 Tax=Paenibacillus silvae TaxID=1325358 RepID=UPI00200320B3|nr:hypothetical protein [Paenibacillus silvae]MCK6074401.1 hypothetical protein [Paenibacillus silvae]MCK6148121.1 hypothetical protein [Paenibacillus silvae]MCK6266421.1 hypothetical protein [Paenibacillus silvae]
MREHIQNIQVGFKCPDCGQEVSTHFMQEQVSSVRCGGCNRAYTLMKPTIGDEILLDWEQEALYHKLRAERSEKDNHNMSALIIKVIELLTWRDQGDGQTRAIQTVKEWLAASGKPQTLLELFHQPTSIKRENKRL